MNDFFDKLGAAAKRAANSVATEVNVAAEEQKLRDLYQSLGKLCYQNVKAGKDATDGYFPQWIAKIDESRQKVHDLKDRKNVTETEPEEDFVEVVD